MLIVNVKAENQLRAQRNLAVAGGCPIYVHVYNNVYLYTWLYFDSHGCVSGVRRATHWHTLLTHYKYLQYSLEVNNRQLIRKILPYYELDSNLL